MRIIRARKDGVLYRRVGEGRYDRSLSKRVEAPKLTRTYEAAVMNRLTSDWTFSPLSADAEIRQNYRNLRARSRDQERNDPYAEHFYTLAEQNVIGHAGITLQMKLTIGEHVDQATGETVPEYDTEANRAIERAWKRQCRRGNYTTTRNMNHVAADKLIVRSMLRDGDLLIRKIVGANNAFGFAIQIFEGDLLDDTYTDFRAVACDCPRQFGLPLCKAGFHEVRMGVELHGDWKFPVAYWLLASHPGDYLLGSAVYALKRMRVDVDEIIHPFIHKRPGQTRGVPALAAAMLRLHMLGGYAEAELVAARAGAQKMGFIESTIPDDYWAENYDKDAGKAQIDAAPGEIEDLGMGRKFVPWDPQHPNGNFPAFVKEQLRGVAACGNSAYTSLSGNLEGVNLSSIRFGVTEEREGYQGLQGFFIEEVKREVFEAWLPCALLSGELDLPFARLDEFTDEEVAIWNGRKWDYMDPLVDIQADVAAIENNLKTKAECIAKTGGDLEAVLAERSREKKLEEKLDITPPMAAGKTDSVSEKKEKEQDGDDPKEGRARDDKGRFVRE